MSRARGESLGTAATDMKYRFMVVKKSTWRGSYPRLFAISRSHVLNVDPSNWNTTNSWALDGEVVGFSPQLSTDVDFTVTVREGRKNSVIKYTCNQRVDLLNALSRMRPLAAPLKPFVAVKISRQHTRINCVLGAAPYGIEMYTPAMEPLSTYLYKDIEKLQIIGDDPTVLAVSHRSLPPPSTFLALTSHIRCALSLSRRLC